MAVKMTMLIQHQTNVGGPAGALVRLGGWSESWYQPGTNIAAARALAINGPGDFGGGILAARAALLPTGSRVVGQRYQLVDPRGPAQSDAQQYPGISEENADVPQMGLLLKVPGTGVGNIRNQILRGLPDIFVRLGEFAPTAPFTALLTTFFLRLGDWYFRGRDLTQTAFTIISISSVGLVTTQLPHGYAVNDRVRILRTLTAAGNVVGMLGYVQAVNSATTFTLNVWTHGSAVGGTVRKEVIIFPQVQDEGISISRVVTRRVGRPFVGYRGRRRGSRN